MELAKRSLLVRWAYLSSEPPRVTNLCALFWRTVLLSPIQFVCALCMLLLGLATLPIWGPIVWLHSSWSAYQTNKEWEEFYNPAPPRQPRFKFVKEAYWAIKNRVCPLVFLVDGLPAPKEVPATEEVVE